MGRAGAPSPLARQRRRAAWLFVLPVLLVLAAVAGWPLLRTVYFAFTDATLSGLEPYRVIGADNFAALARDPDWWRAVWNTVLLAAVSVTLETLLGLVIALTLDAHLPGRGLLRAAVLIPWAIPTVVSAQMWNWMYNDLYGVLNAILLALGLVEAPLAWTANPDLALFAVIAVDVWKTTPFMALLILAALQLVPGEIYEAARIDGIPPLTVFWRITLPLIRPALMVAIIFRTLDALRIFDLPYVLTGNSRYTASMAVFARQQLVDFQDVGYGSAASTFLFLVVAAFTVIYLTAGRVRLGGAGS
ncbi:MAG TPA: sugar ABC transporter permease [Anaeromyxobacteraceae bacterium]|nr:sugar ABC transporter permease [Anaeromyxobacteraceae bacterium]